MEVYESHLGGIYFDNDIIDPGLLYCDECGDHDDHLGHADSWEEVLNFITGDDGWCKYDREYVSELEAEWKDLMGAGNDITGEN